MTDKLDPRVAAAVEDAVRVITPYTGIAGPMKEALARIDATAPGRCETCQRAACLAEDEGGEERWWCDHLHRAVSDDWYCADWQAKD